MHEPAYIPFLHPLELGQAWPLLLVPIAALIALAYKSIRTPPDANLPKAALFMTIQILGLIVVLAAALSVLTEIILPAMARG